MLTLGLLLPLPALVIPKREEEGSRFCWRLHAAPNGFCDSRQLLEDTDVVLVDGAAPLAELLQESAVFVVAIALDLLGAAGEDVELGAVLQLLQLALVLLVVAMLLIDGTVVVRIFH